MSITENRTLFVGNLSERVTEDLIYELFLQAGPLQSVRIPVQNGRNRNFGFVEFKHEVSVPYAARLFHQTYLFGRMLNLQYQNRYNRFQMTDSIMCPNPVTARLGPPIKEHGHHHSAMPVRRPNHLSQKRLPQHMMPTPARQKNRNEFNNRNNIPDFINYHGLIDKEDKNKQKPGHKQVDTGNKQVDTGNKQVDLRSKIKKKKKKKSKEHSRNSGEDNSVAKERSQINSQKSYIKNAVNHLKHYSRHNRGSYDLNRKTKFSRHIRFDT